MGGQAPFPDRIAGYRLIRKLGSGGMGTVFEAVEERQGVHVALKLITPAKLASNETLKRFRQEGRIASVVTHPRCVFVLAVDEEAGRPYLVMELMPGTTLQSLVEEAGPLPPVDAILKTLDVVEGLAEFHKLGMIHRDVKPANCFLDDEARVKIGDFGLSKPLDGGIDLTRTGSFLGTPLYASPEQIKRETLDERTDVYSVAATLYFLISGRPPFEARDATEALARIVSEPAPPLGTVAPMVSRALETVVHKGLERDRTRRWRNLREFHDALLPFVPERIDIGSIGLRLGAYAIDLALFYVGVWAAFAVIFLAHRGLFLETVAFGERHGRLIEWLDLGLWIAYFVIAERICAASIGKWLVGLRVAKAHDNAPPDFAHTLVRTLVFVLLVGLGGEVYEEVFPPHPDGDHKLGHFFRITVLNALGALIIVLPMRQKTGFRGVHEWLSGTRVIQVIHARRTRRIRQVSRFRDRIDSQVGSSTNEDPVRRVGPYQIQGTIASNDHGELLAGLDSSLDRQVWIVERPPGSPPPPPARRTLNRLTRPRWIGGVDQTGGRWDAFTAPSGCRLRAAVESSGLPWSDVLPILTDLTEELDAARGDGTLPRRLDLDQVWLQPDGRVQLIDLLDLDPPADESESATDDEPHTLAFVRDAARLALEGNRPHRRLSLSAWSKREGAHKRIQGAVPERVGRMLDRLTGHQPSYTSLADFRADLLEAAERPTEVGPGRRGLQTLIQTFLLSPSLLAFVGLTCPELDPGVIPRETWILDAIPILWVLWAMIVRGGVSFRLAGLALVGRDGRLASCFRCGVRAFLVWCLPTLLLLGSQLLQFGPRDALPWAWTLWLMGVAILGLYPILAIRFPNRGPHDHLSGTTVVPI